MKNRLRTTRVAAVQAESVVLDRERTVEKACGIIADASQNGAELIVFPELFIPNYISAAAWGRGLAQWSPTAKAAWLRLWRNAVEIPSSVTEALGEVARSAGATVVIGMHERERDSKTLYNTLLFIGPSGDILGKHRKLMPTNHERLVHGVGDGSTLKVYDTPAGRIGGLICWENWMPLARFSLYSQGEQIHIAPTAYDDDVTLANIRNTAFEGGVYVISANVLTRKDSYPEDFELGGDLSAAGEFLSTGGSAIAGPEGDLLAGPVWGEESILYADLDLTSLVKHGQTLDVTGHYARPDIFSLQLDSNPKRNLNTPSITDDQSNSESSA